MRIGWKTVCSRHTKHLPHAELCTVPLCSGTNKPPCTNVEQPLPGYIHNIKSFRAALYDFRVNLLNSLTLLKKSFLPMSIIPIEQLYKVLQIVQLMDSGKTRQTNFGNTFTRHALLLRDKIDNLRES